MGSKNNIFEFGRSEKVQDAFICWCINWFNDDSKPKLKQMATKFVKILSGKDDIKSVEIQQQKLKIDILLKVNGDTFVIIEDKVYGSEHGDQIRNYRDKVFEAINNPEEEYFPEGSEVRTVYLKTGFFYDEDVLTSKKAEVDVTIDADKFLEILTPYTRNSEILNSYVVNLKEIKAWYKEHENYIGVSKDSWWEWNIVNDMYTQYRLMREIFPEKLWYESPQTDEWCWLYRIDHNSNVGGRPWTECTIIETIIHPVTDKEYEFFWRIDSNKNGPYLSLRLYEKKSDKNGKFIKEQHQEVYGYYSSVIEELVEENKDQFGYSWDDIKSKRYSGSYRESDIINIELADYLENWDAKKCKLIKFAQGLSVLLRRKLLSED